MRRTSSGAKARVHTGRGGIHHSPNPRGPFSYNTLLFAASILVIFLYYQPEGGCTYLLTHSPNHLLTHSPKVGGAFSSLFDAVASSQEKLI